MSNPVLNPGDAIPDLPLALGNGETVRLGDYAGRWLVLYFYPKDNTPGCTREGQEFRDSYEQFKEAGAEILGVSRDSVKTHANFCARHEFPFQLVADVDESLCRAFDVIQEKNMYGRKVLGIVRSTFLIDPAQRLHTAWRGVRVPGHVDTVLETLQRA